MNDRKDRADISGGAPQEAAAEEKAHAPFLYALMPMLAAAAGAAAYCSYRHETAAGVFMLACAIFIGFFARERLPVVGIIVPAYAAVLFTGNFTLSAAYVGVCTAIGVGAFIFRINRISFAVSAVLAAGAGALLLGPAGALVGVAFVIPALVLGHIYPRSSVGEAMAFTSLAAVAAAAVFGGLFVCLSPGLGLPEGITGIGDIADRLREEFISRVTAAYTAAGLDVGSGAAEQYVDSVIRMLPGLLAVAAEVVGFFSAGVCGALFRTLGIEPEEFTAAPSRAMLSPMAGIVYFLSSLTYLIISGSAGDGVAAVVCENIMLTLALPLAVFAVSAVRRTAAAAGMHFLGSLAVAAVIFAAIFGGWQGICLFAAVGGVICFVIPLRRMIAGRRDGGGNDRDGEE